jgi:hypothetical protein
MSNDTELGDYCEWQPDQVVQESDMNPYPTQATWSNKAAAAGHNPCQPVAGPYFNAIPVLPSSELISVPGFGDEKTPSIQIAVGKSATIELDLYSDAATSGPMTVGALDYALEFAGQARELEFAFDKTSGVNGEKVHLTVTAEKAGAVIPGGSIFVITVVQPEVNGESVWPVYVEN